MTITPLEALLTAPSAELFQSVESRMDVFRPDPYDVEEVHAEAREAFDELVSRAGNDDRDGSGAILLLLGASGSGKTHLMRAFRNRVHAADRGFVCYAQMTATASNYGRYLLHHSLESLGMPYDSMRGPTTGLTMLSDRLCSVPGVCSDEELETLRKGRTAKEVHGAAHRVSHRIVVKQQRASGRDLDPEIVQALVLLQRRNALIDNAVQKYLKCQPLSDANRRYLGGLVARTQEEDPALVMRELARILAALDGGALVLCIDQLEDAYAPDDSTAEKFRRTMLSLREFTDASPNVIVVIGCLEDYWSALRSTLSQSILDRIEQAPPSVELRAVLEPHQIRAVIATRLHAWLEDREVAIDPQRPLAPFEPSQLDRLNAMRTRDVLVACDRVTRQARARRRAPDLEWIDSNDDAPPVEPAADHTRWSVAWDDFRAEYQPDTPEDEQALAELLAETLTQSACEIGPDARLACRAVDNRVVIRAEGVGELPVASLVICDRSSRGGGLKRQLEAAIESRSNAGEKVAILRTSEFPNNPRTKVVQALGRLIADGHRRAQCPPAQWHVFLAMRAFHAQHAGNPGYLTWRRKDRPVLSQQCLLDALGSLQPVSHTAPSEARPTPAPDVESTNEASEARPAPWPAADRAAESPGTEPATFPIGHSVGIRQTDVGFRLQDLKRHAAFLGGSGSGKTTLALTVLEAAALRGVPAILVDRKGDLGSYADPEAWAAVEPEKRDRAEHLRSRLDVQLYTPGEPGGRDLAVPLLPPAHDRLSSRERESIIRHYASALVGMLPVSKANSMRNHAIIGHGLQILDQFRDQGQVDKEPTVSGLAEFLRSGDPALAAALASFQPRQIQKVAEDLEALAYTQPILRPEPGTERLDVAGLLGRRNASAGTPSSVRLSILNLSGLAQDENVLFFVTHLLTGLKRLAASSPSDELQGVVLLDEADLYLPATKSPSTKPLLEDGLKRFRSGGIGLLLGTQSPGDLDYKGRENIHTWFLGGIKQDRALKKLEPMFRDRHAMSQLANQGRGEFTMLQDGTATRLKAARNLLETRQVSPDRAAELARRLRAR